MLFVLSDGFIINLSNLRLDYQKRTGVTLDESQQPYAISLFFGAKDIKARNKQISFIEKWLAAFQKDLHIENPLTPEEVQKLFQKMLSAEKTTTEDTQAIVKYESSSSPITAEAIENQITALRVLITTCLYVKSQIDSTYTVRSGSSAILEQLMNEAMGATSTNYIDEETKACCLLATKRFLSEKGRFEAINASLKSRFTEKQWADFSNFVTHECDALKGKYKTNYPVTSVMMPLMGKPLEFAGYTTGFILGEMVGKSTKLLRTRHALTAAIGSGLMLIMGPSASVGVMLLAPTYAGRILDTFCGVTLAWILGAAGNIAGQGLGLGVGLSVDLSWKIMYNSFTLLSRLYSGRNHLEKLNGISLISGHRIVDGAELKIVDMENLAKELPQDYQLCPVTFDIGEDALKVTVNEQQTAIIPWSKDNQLIYMEELQKLFAARAQIESQEHGDVIPTVYTPLVEQVDEVLPSSDAKQEGLKEVKDTVSSAISLF
ncbi:hypothetical protein [Legionella brunensis]|uniref:Substrate of the Dot/Icm secretion system n=1 Tax=Legionella brunensis TaxID=29422 RepID=A0A0W0SM80_9GAMM|nr:hypothetical protein [Legionella brunensis]KTC84053.1 substrate of the Dot/Icm secretion system [Legionella brunensis]